MKKIKDLMDAGVFGWTLVVGDMKFETDGTKKDSENLVDALSKPAVRAIIDKAIQRGATVSVLTDEATSGHTSNEGSREVLAQFNNLSLASLRPKSPLRIGAAIDKHAGEHKLVLENDSADGEPAGVVISKANGVTQTGATKSDADRKTTLNAFKKFIASGALHNISLDSFVHELETKHFIDFLTHYASRKPQRIKTDNSKKRAQANVKTTLPEQNQGKASIQNQVLSEKTLSKQKSYLTAFVKYCRLQGALLTGTELVGESFSPDLLDHIKKITNKNTKGKSYMPFEHDELKRLFEPDLYFWCARGDANYFWAPLISLHTGMRGKEIATLTLKSIREHADLGLFTIQLFPDDTKNLNSAREVPIPQKLVDVGLIDYVSFLRDKIKTLPQEQQDEYPLFPNVNVDSATFLSDPHKNVSRSFSVYRRMKYLAMDANFKVFHSFRHTVVSMLDAVGVDITMRAMIVGHMDADDENAIKTDHWKNRATLKQVKTNLIYTKEVHGFETIHQLVRMKMKLDQIASLYELDYSLLREGALAVQELLRCENLLTKKWKGGFQWNQKDKIRTLPPSLVPKDVTKYEDFSWK